MLQKMICTISMLRGSLTTRAVSTYVPRSSMVSMVASTSVTTESREIRTAAKTTRRLRFFTKISTSDSHKTDDRTVRSQP